MKSKRNLIVSILQLVLGIFAVAAFAVVGLSGGNDGKSFIFSKKKNGRAVA